MCYSSAADLRDGASALRGRGANVVRQCNPDGAALLAVLPEPEGAIKEEI